MPFIPHIDKRQNISIVSLEDKMMLNHFHLLSLSFDMNKISSDNYFSTGVTYRRALLPWKFDETTRLICDDMFITKSDEI